MVRSCKGMEKGGCWWLVFSQFMFAILCSATAQPVIGMQQDTCGTEHVTRRLLLLAEGTTLTEDVNEAFDNDAHKIKKMLPADIIASRPVSTANGLDNDTFHINPSEPFEIIRRVEKIAYLYNWKGNDFVRDNRRFECVKSLHIIIAADAEFTDGELQIVLDNSVPDDSKKLSLYKLLRTFNGERDKDNPLDVTVFLQVKKHRGREGDQRLRDSVDEKVHRVMIDDLEHLNLVMFVATLAPFAPKRFMIQGDTTTPIWAFYRETLGSRFNEMSMLAPLHRFANKVLEGNEIMLESRYYITPQADLSSVSVDSSRVIQTKEERKAKVEQDELKEKRRKLVKQLKLVQGRNVRDTHPDNTNRRNDEQYQEFNFAKITVHYSTKYLNAENSEKASILLPQWSDDENAFVEPFQVLGKSSQARLFGGTITPRERGFTKSDYKDTHVALPAEERELKMREQRKLRDGYRRSACMGHNVSRPDQIFQFWREFKGVDHSELSELEEEIKELYKTWQTDIIGRYQFDGDNKNSNKKEAQHYTLLNDEANNKIEVCLLSKPQAGEYLAVIVSHKEESVTSENDKNVEKVLKKRIENEDEHWQKQAKESRDRLVQKQGAYVYRAQVGKRAAPDFSMVFPWALEAEDSSLAKRLPGLEFQNNHPVPADEPQFKDDIEELAINFVEKMSQRGGVFHIAITGMANNTKIESEASGTPLNGKYYYPEIRADNEKLCERNVQEPEHGWLKHELKEVKAEGLSGKTMRIEHNVVMAESSPYLASVEHQGQSAGSDQETLHKVTEHKSNCGLSYFRAQYARDVLHDALVAAQAEKDSANDFRWVIYSRGEGAVKTNEHPSWRRVEIELIYPRNNR